MTPQATTGAAGSWTVSRRALGAGPSPHARPRPQGQPRRPGWDLFADWCAAAGRIPVPASLTTLQRFLADCPAAESTQRRRLRDIVAEHRDRGVELGRRTPWLPSPNATAAGLVDATTQAGYRDAALMAAVSAGMSVRAAVESPAAAVIGFAPRAKDPAACGRCAVAAWAVLLRASQTGGRHAASDALDGLNHRDRSEHVCAHLDAMPDGPLIRSVDQHGWVGRGGLNPRAAKAILRRLRSAPDHSPAEDAPEPVARQRHPVDPGWSAEVDGMLDDLEPALDDALDAVQRMLDAATQELDALLELRRPAAR